MQCMRVMASWLVVVMVLLMVGWWLVIASGLSLGVQFLLGEKRHCAVLGAQSCRTSLMACLKTVMWDLRWSLGVAVGARSSSLRTVVFLIQPDKSLCYT